MRMRSTTRQRRYDIDALRVGPVLGNGRRLLSRPSRMEAWASEMAYSFYIWQQTMIVLVAIFLVQRNAPLVMQFLVALSLSLVGTAAGYKLGRRVAILRP